MQKVQVQQQQESVAENARQLETFGSREVVLRSAERGPRPASENVGRATPRGYYIDRWGCVCRD